MNLSFSETKTKMKTNQWKLHGVRTIDSKSHVLILSFISLAFLPLEELSGKWKVTHIFGTLLLLFMMRVTTRFFYPSFFSSLVSFVSLSNRPFYILGTVFTVSKHFSTSLLCFQCYAACSYWYTFVVSLCLTLWCILNIFGFFSLQFSTFVCHSIRSQLQWWWWENLLSDEISVQQRLSIGSVRLPIYFPTAYFYQHLLVDVEITWRQSDVKYYQQFVLYFDIKPMDCWINCELIVWFIF